MVASGEDDAEECALVVELLDALVDVESAVAVLTVAETTRRRRFNAQSSRARDGKKEVVWNHSFACSARHPTGCWIDVWDAAKEQSPDGYLGKINLPLDSTRPGVPHFVQANLLQGGPLRARLRVDPVTVRPASHRT